MKLEGKLVRLEYITKEYTNLIIKWRNKEWVRKNFIFQEKFTDLMHNTWIDNYVETGKVVQFIIFNKLENVPVGSVFLRDIDKINNKAEFGIFIGEESARGKGFGTESTMLICKYGFNVLKLNKIMLRVFSNNEAAIRTYQKAGFVQEALLKEEVNVNEEYRDIVLMAKFEHEGRGERND